MSTDIRTSLVGEKNDCYFTALNFSTATATYALTPLLLAERSFGLVSGLAQGGACWPRPLCRARDLHRITHAISAYCCTFTDLAKVHSSSLSRCPRFPGQSSGGRVGFWGINKTYL